MRWILCTSATLVVIVLSWTATTPAAQDTEEQVKAKLQELQKKLTDLDAQKAKLLEVQQQLEEAQRKIETLRKQEEALKKDLEQKAREKEYYVKVEIKGRLSYATSATYGPQTEKSWQVTAQGTTWELDLSKDKKFLELAKKAKGKTVVVTGTHKAAQWKSYGWPQPAYPSPQWQTYPSGPGSLNTTTFYFLTGLPGLTVTDLQLVD